MCLWGWGFDLLGLDEIRIPFLMNDSKCCLHNSFEHQTWEKQGNMACLHTGKRNPGDYNFNMEAILLWTKRSRDSQRKTDFSLHFLIFSRLKGKCSSIWKLRILVPYHIDFLSSLSTCIFTPCNSFFYVLQGEMFSYIVFIRIISPQKLPVTPQNT